MRCKNCPYLKYDYEYSYCECRLGIESSENSKMECGCRYNITTLKKIEKEIDNTIYEEFKGGK